MDAFWAQFFASITGAFLGVLGIAGVLFLEQRERYRSKFDAALSGALHALGDRAIELSVWLETAGVIAIPSSGRIARLKDRNDVTGGPDDARMQTAIDVAWMMARRGDLKVKRALGDVTYDLKLARTVWQVHVLGEIVGHVRKWRTGEHSPADVIRELERIGHDARASADSVVAG